MTITLPKGSLVNLATKDLSEHNRQAFEVPLDDLKTDARTANGFMRRYYVASKRKFTLSWNMLPALDGQTVDGKAGRNTIRGIHDTNIGITLTLIYGEVDSSNNPSAITVTVFIDSYSETLVKRYERQFWNISMTLVEE